MKLRLSDVLRDPEKRKALRGILMGWHGLLQDNRGERARLRREKKPLDIYVSEVFRRGIVARFQSKELDFDEPSLEKLAIPAGVLSHVKTLYGGGHFATLFARSDTGSANMKDVRFRKLLSIDDKDHDAHYTMLLRMVRLMGDKAGLDGLVEGTCFWNDFSRRNWARKYYSEKR